MGDTDDKRSSGAFSQIKRLIGEHADEIGRVHADEEGRRQELEEKLRSQQEDRPIIPIRDWIENEYYTGSMGRTMFDALKEDLVTVFEGDEASGGEPYFEVCMGGSMGWGKSVCAKAIGMRALYEISCYAVPQFSIGRAMTRNASIMFVNYNVSEPIARGTIFRELREDIDKIEYFQNEFAPDPRITRRCEFPRRVVWQPHQADGRGAVSENLAFAILDECNEYDYIKESLRSVDGGLYDAAEMLYGKCSRRIINRCMLPGDEDLQIVRMPRVCKLITVSQARYPDDFIERRRRAAEETPKPGQPRRPVKVLWYEEWGTRPKRNYSMGWFWCAVARPGRQHEIYHEHHVGTAEAAAWRDKMRASDYDVRAVPFEYLEEFQKDVDESVRNYIGVASETIRPFIRQKETVQLAVNKRRDIVKTASLPDELMRHPYSVEVTTLKDAARWIVEALCWYDEQSGRHIPYVNPHAERYAHFDLSKNRCDTGFCFGHVFDCVEVQRIERLGDDNDIVRSVKELAPVIWMDVVLQITAPHGGVIDLATCQVLVDELADLGFSIGLVSYDQALSEESRQRMEARGYPVGMCSVDRDMGPYESLRRALTEERLAYYHYEPLISELHGLEESLELKQVRHRPGKSKDVSDALASVVWHCETLGMEGAVFHSDTNAQRAMMPRIQQAAGRGKKTHRKRRPLKGVLPAWVVAMYLGEEIEGAEPPWSGNDAGGTQDIPDIHTRYYGRDGD